MQGYIDQRPDKDTPPQFQPPANIVFMPVDTASGTASAHEAPGAIVESFIAGTEPGGLARTPE